MLPTLIAAGYALAAVAAMLLVIRGYAKVPQLRDRTPVGAGDEPPSVSILVAARDEERHVEEAVRSLLRVQYPDVELIVVNDRSTDRTGEILSRVAGAEPRLQIVDVTELPDGWLGKNHAMHVGAARARGELLLFADGDIIFAPEALARAVRLLLDENADHVTVAPQFHLPSIPLRIAVNYAMMWGLLAVRPWDTPDPKSSAFMGIGAFNLVRRSAYDDVGGHTRIPLRPDDDLMLGKLLKRAGHRQIVAGGMGQLEVEWYRDLRDAAVGFRKNTFAALQYSVVLATLAMLSNVAGAWPFAAVWMTAGTERLFYMVAAGAFMAGMGTQAVYQKSSPWTALFYPLGALMTAGLIADVVTRNLWHGAIEWRGTWYPLDALRANRV